MENNLIKQLKYAIDIGDIDFLEFNKNRFDINYRFEDEDNDTLLLFALSNADNDIYEFFLKNNADITLINDKGENAIHSIVYSGVNKRLIKILSQYELNINFQSEDGTSPLLLSVLLESFEIFKSLIRFGADVNLSDQEGNMPIHPACSLGYESMVIELIENGAILNAKTKKGNLPLALAVNGEHVEIIKYLYKKMYGI